MVEERAKRASRDRSRQRVESRRVPGGGPGGPVPPVVEERAKRASRDRSLQRVSRGVVGS
ncbi:hypothetical protein NOCARDAX2BIS_400176 [Nocardioides sp. AX2bis]|nr:hypothetical protein NOCARDAX2BIS_400176 [Nocardioides sp. AX2bis]